MPTPTGTSTFVEIYNVMYNSIPIFGVTRIDVNRRKSIMTGMDNNKLRPVSSHLVGIGETVTVNSEDGNALSALMSQTGAHDLTFVWKAAAQNVGSNILPDQDVTIKNVVFDGNGISFGSKRITDGSVTGLVLETTDDTDPVVIVAHV